MAVSGQAPGRSHIPVRHKGLLQRPQVRAAEQSTDVRLSSSASNNGSSNRSSRCRAAVFAPMDFPANPSNARRRKGPSDLGVSVLRENSVTFAGDQLNEAGTAAQTRAALTEANMLNFFMIVSDVTRKLIDQLCARSLDLDQLNYLGGLSSNCSICCDRPNIHACV